MPKMLTSKDSDEAVVRHNCVNYKVIFCHFHSFTRKKYFHYENFEVFLAACPHSPVIHPLEFTPV